MSFLKDINFWVGAAGIPLALWGIYLALRHRDPGEISYCRETAIGLFSEIAKNIEHLEINYRGELVSERLHFVKAYFINTGRKDVTAEMVDQPLALELSNGARWIEAKVVLASPDVKAIASISDHTLKFTFPMLRRGEFFCFEGLADIPEGKDFESVCEPTHRIADTRSIPRKPVSFGKPHFLGMLLIQFVLLAGIFVWQAMLSKEGGLVYKYTPNGVTNSVEVTVAPRKDGVVELRTGLVFKKTLKTFQTAEAFRASNELTVESKAKTKTSVETIMPAGMLCLLLFMITPLAYRYRQAHKVRKMVKLTN